MAVKKRRIKKAQKNRPVFLASILGIAFLAFLIFILYQIGASQEYDIYISSENPKQGDTVLIKVNGGYSAATGVFEDKNIIFFRNGKYSDWFAVLGIDASLKPGNYKISVFVPEKTIEKQVTVESKDFPSTKMAISQDLQDKGYTASTVLTNISNKDNPSLEEVLETFTPRAYFTSAFSMPLKSVSKSGFDFGEIIKFTGYDVRHFGIDLKAGIDTNVLAVNNGKVVLASELSNYGKTIVIDHGLGIFSLYLHLDEFKVQEGDFVKNGQIIALSGDSGYAAGPHLHFSMRDNGAKIDPISFIKETEDIKQQSSLASLSQAFFRFLGSTAW